jgi:aspartyl-tRNA(Asn)/glutamyl-tRNA(Gln) amidotransferase subunit A
VASDPADFSAAELVDLYRAGKLSPVEVTEAVFARIDKVNPKVNAFTVIDRENGLKDARAAEVRWKQGKPLSGIDGVPTSIKDLVLTKGWPTLRGSKTVDKQQAWDTDAPLVARLREAGAVLIGKTTTPEFGWKGLGDSPLTGITRNPWKLDRTTGGSSAGAAAAVVAGMGPLASGSDGGGSIRIPSGFTGCYGIKPHFGRVPSWPASPFGTVSHNGPMTRTVRDSAMMLNVMAKPDARDWYSLPYDGRDYTADLEAGVKGLKIAFSPNLGYAPVDPEVAASVAKAAKAFEGLGAHVEQADPGFSDPYDVFWTHWIAGAFNALGALPKEKRDLLEPGLNASVEQGSKVGLKTYLDAVGKRAELGTAMRQFHEKYDLLLTPSLSVPALKHGEMVPAGWKHGDTWPTWTPFSYPFNLTQQPAASIPCGFTREGLPIGLHIVGPAFREDLVLRASRAYETVYSIAKERPPLT